MGAISRATARIAKGLGLELYGHDPFAGASAFDEVGVKRCATLDDLLAVSDILSLHCPLTEQTRTVINSATIAKLPRGARSEEHTSELQSLMRISYAVFCLKKKRNHIYI